MQHSRLSCARRSKDTIVSSRRNTSGHNGWGRHLFFPNFTRRRWERAMKELRTSLRAPVSLVRGPFFRANCSQFGRKLIAAVLLAGATLAMVSGSAEAAAPVQASCQLQSAGGQIKRVVFIIFDNVHLRRDNPNVPSDLEQMPNLLNFLQGKGVISGNHHTPLISHTADDILTGLTGVYGDRHGSRSRTASGFSRRTIPRPFSRRRSFTGRPRRRRAILRPVRTCPSS